MLGERRSGPWLGWRLPRPALRQILWRLLPSPLARALGYVDADAAIPKPHATSWLNGLRGISALIVVNMHITESSYNLFHQAYGLSEDGKLHLVQLPLVRLLLAGHFMVSIFFVVSGYALSLGPLELAHSGRSGEELASRLGSSSFRRIPRLFLPVIPVLAATMVPRRLGAWYPFAASRAPSPAAPSWAGLVASAGAEFISMVHGLDPSALVSMSQSWTLAAECASSFVVFSACLALRRASCRNRAACVALLAAWLGYVKEWQTCMFLCGMVIADTGIARRRRRRAEEGVAAAAASAVDNGAAPLLLPGHDEEKALPPSTSADGGGSGGGGGGPRRLAAAPAATTTRLETAGWSAVLLLALLLGGWPLAPNAFDAAPYSWPVRLLGLPGPLVVRYILAAGSVLLVAALDRLPAAARRPLDSRPALYLGEISYGLYLCHMLAARTSLSIGLRVELERRWGGAHGTWGRLAAWAVVMFGVALPGALWLGDLHWRFVDKKCVRFSRWLAERVGV
ncbi:hypothetical protein RB601_003697 [Gaeumannomyces tritici]